MILYLNKVNVFYDKFHALWDISLNVNKGEVVALIGSNGAGKTTILNTIIGLLKPKSGSIVFKDIQIEKLPPPSIVRLGIAMVPESKVIFPHMTVLEHLLLGAQIPRAWDKRKDLLEWVFALFPRLRERKNQKAKTLSGGEAQMLNIARALMSAPELLLLDEPSLGLAPKLVDTIFEVINKLRNEVTILIAEQYIYKVLSISDRAYLIENGRIVLEGYSDELFENVIVKQKYLSR
jgi:branched-chain amino acid transport system ATP-binding protein